MLSREHKKAGAKRNDLPEEGEQQVYENSNDDDDVCDEQVVSNGRQSKQVEGKQLRRIERRSKRNIGETESIDQVLERNDDDDDTHDQLNRSEDQTTLSSNSSPTHSQTSG